MDKLRIISGGLILFLAVATYQLAFRRQEQGIPEAVLADIETAEDYSDSAAFPDFQDLTLALGINFSHHQNSDTLSGINESLGAGVCVFDFDNDGWMDLFLVGGSGQTRYYGKQAWWARPAGNKLYRNNRGTSFTEVSEQAGIVENIWGMGCASADLDNDGDSDFIVTAIGQNLLYRNNGDGTFTETGDAVFSGEDWSTSVAVADYDGDGLTDIYITNYLQYSRGARTFEFNSGFQSTMPEAFNAVLYDGAANRLFRNLGNLQFEEVAEDLGVDDKAGRGLQPVWLDINDDNLPDLLVVNDTGSPNQLFLNTGKGGFEKSATALQVEAATGHHGAAVADINNDGRHDIVLSAPNGYPPSLLVRQSALPASSPYLTRDINWDSGLASDARLSLGGWGVVSADFDNNGITDLYFNNGLIVPDSNSEHVAAGQPNTLFLGTGAGSPIFTSHTDTLAMPGRGLAYADFDNDGDIDLFVSNNNNDGQLLYNQVYNQDSDGDATSGRWIGIELVNRYNNRDGLHAKVTVETETGRFHRDTYSRQGFLSSSDSRVHLGLGAAKSIKKLTVHWGDGSMSTFRDLIPDQYLRIHQRRSTLIVIEIDAVDSGATDATGSHDNNVAEVEAWQFPPNLNPLREPFQDFLPEYLALLTEIAGAHPLDDNLIQAYELQQFYRYGNRDIKLAVLTLLQQANAPELTELAYAAVQSEDRALKLAGISVLQAHESEPAVYRLLPLFEDSTEDVLCRLTEAFRFFFQEEEAVIHRETLALPALVRLLDHENPHVVVCALRALGEAEQYRGIERIIALTDSEHLAIQIAAINTLGRIRDGKAMARLHVILTDDDMPAEVVAETLTALSRLADNDLQTHLAAAIVVDATQPFPDNIARAVLVSDLLLHRESGDTVFPPAQIRSLLLTALNPVSPQVVTGSVQDDDPLMTTLIALLSESDSAEASRLLTSFTKTPDNQLRLQENALLKDSAAQTFHNLDADETNTLFLQTVSEGEYATSLSLLQAVLGARQTWLNNALLTLFNARENAAPEADNTLITDAPASSTFLANVLDVVDASSFPQKQFLFVKALGYDDSAIQVKALSLLAQHLDNPNTYNRLLAVLKEPAADTRVRLAAAGALARHEPTTVLALLRK